MHPMLSKMELSLSIYGSVCESSEGELGKGGAGGGIVTLYK